MADHFQPQQMEARQRMGPPADDMRPPPDDMGPPPGEMRPPPGEAPPAFRQNRPSERGPRRRMVRLDVVSIFLFIMVLALSMAVQITRRWRITEQRAAPGGS